MSAGARPVDHCVLPTADLAVARARLSLLGFTVAPDAMHPFGTQNCCVFFADNTYLEPLAIADAARAAAASRLGNVFTVRNAAYRDLAGHEGFSGLVLGTGDADADHRDFTRSGVSAGDQLNFSRPFVDASGHEDIATFKLAFAADARSPEAFFFTCERVNAPVVDRATLQAHANGVRRIKAVVLAAREPSDFAEFLSLVCCVHPIATPDGGLRLPMSNADILVRPGHGERKTPDSGLRLAGILFGVADIRRVQALLNAGAVQHEAAGDRITVAAAPGQGAVFAFEAVGSS
ncbi:MAG: VOC family protein [Hyphomicrobiales bacterium]|nr:VOC family protein [Hyphomicrobiales bacterium]